MISVLDLSVVDLGFEHQSSQTKDLYIGICYISANHTVLRNKSKY
jgi:hypothetical protein